MEVPKHRGQILTVSFMIVFARDKRESAAFLAGMLDLAGCIGDVVRAYS
jgi:hypothetical protein